MQSFKSEAELDSDRTVIEIIDDRISKINKESH